MSALDFPVGLPVFGVTLHPHPVFEILAYGVGFALFRRARRRADFLPARDRWSLVVAVVFGALAGSKVLHHLAAPSQWPLLAERPLLLLGGKTIVGGLLGGWLAVEVTKRCLGIERRTGDLYALPLVVGIAIGRVGCFLTGLEDRTFGVATSAPWGIDFGDGIPRHPTQLYEIGFLVALALVLRSERVRRREGAAFRVFLAGYLAFRLVVDAWKPYDSIVFGLQGIQLACLAGLLALAVTEGPAGAARTTREEHGARLERP